MSLSNLLFLILDNLGRRKARVGLTAVGVIIGTAAVVILVSLAIGLQQNYQQSLVGLGDLTQISVWPNYGEPVGPSVSGGGAPPNQKFLTNETLVELAAIPGVQAVVPRDWLQTGVILKYGRLEGYGGIVGMGVNDLGTLGLEAVQGGVVLEKGTAVIGSWVPRNFYDPKQRPGQEPPPPPELFGQELKVTLIKWTPEGTEIRKTVPLRIVGVLSETRSEPDGMIYVTIDEVNAWNEWSLGRRINRSKDGYNMIIVQAQDIDQVIDIADQIVALGYMANTPQQFVQGINSFYLVLQIAFGGVGAIALLVAAIGIANTMAMAILERTREIGLMKAVGATNRDVLSIFLGEAAGIGFIGGLGGILLGWSLGQVINVVAMSYLAGQAVQTGGPPPSIAVYTPAWLPLFTLMFSTFVGLVSGLYPALRAATLVPVTALKYE